MWGKIANPPRKLQAYAIFGGGGVRGVGFAGALAAAESLNIEFVGFGGVSAGSVIALLAAAGYSGQAICDEITKDDVLTQLLDDKGVDLVTLKNLLTDIQRAPNLLSRVGVLLRFLDRKDHWELLSHILSEKHGLYSGRAALEVLRNLIVDKNRNQGLPATGPISFQALGQVGRKVPLKVLASNLTTRRQVIFPDPDKPADDPLNESVVGAVRASMTVPIVYTPYELGSMRLVDGGASNSLPVFLFEPEFKVTHVPIIAFELVDSARVPRPGEQLAEAASAEPYDFFTYVSDLASTASSSTDAANRITTDGIHIIHLDVPEAASLDFGRDKKQLIKMIDRGHQAALDQLRPIVKLEPWAAARRTRLRDNVTLLLQALVHHIEDPTHRLLEGCRAYIMLCTDDNMRELRFQVRMLDSDPDRNMKIGLTDGPSGVAWTATKPLLISLDDYRAKALPTDILPPARQRSIISVSLKQYNGQSGDLSDDQLPLLGTLSVDSLSPIGGSDFIFRAFQNPLEEIVRQWAEAISVQLSHS